MKRVLVIGSGGSGKTTLARRMAARTGLPLLHLDTLYWKPGWQATPIEEWRERIRSLSSGDAWILDGNYSSTLDLRFAACDTVVFLDLPRTVCMWRAVTRQVFGWGGLRPELPPGCRERWDWQYLWWIWSYPERRRGGDPGTARLPGSDQACVRAAHVGRDRALPRRCAAGRGPRVRSAP